MKNFSLIVTVTSFFLLFSVISSSAAPINNWTFDIQYGFTSYTGVDEAGNNVDSNTQGYGVHGTDVNTDFKNYPSKLQWGRKTNIISYFLGGVIIGNEWNWTNSSEVSSIYLDPGSVYKTIELGQRSDGITLYHDNNSIPSSNTDNDYYRTTFLNTATLSSRLTVTPEGFGGLSWEKNFDIKFYETINPAHDVFLIDGFNESLSETFQIGDGYTYLASFEVEDFDWFDDYNSFGFKTPENDTTEKTTSFSIDLVSGPTNPTPEPSTLVLFGLGIVGFAGIIRKKLK